MTASRSEKFGNTGLMEYQDEILWSTVTGVVCPVDTYNTAFREYEKEHGDISWGDTWEAFDRFFHETFLNVPEPFLGSEFIDAL